MKTKLNMIDDSRSQKPNETLVRDSKQLKVDRALALTSLFVGA